MTMLYAVIWGRSTILCDHQIGGGSYADLARQMLPNVPVTTAGKKTYTSNNVLFHTMVENDLVFMCAAEPEFGARLPYAFLTEVKATFFGKGLASASLVVGGLEFREFRSTLTALMERYSRGESNDKVSKLQAEVDEVKNVMTENVEKILARGELLDDLIEKTESLQENAVRFHHSATKVRRKMWWQNMKMKLIIGCVITVILLILVVVILFATKVLPPSSSSGGTAATTTTTTSKPAGLSRVLRTHVF